MHVIKSIAFIVIVLWMFSGRSWSTLNYSMFVVNAFARAMIIWVWQWFGIHLNSMRHCVEVYCGCDITWTSLTKARVIFSPAQTISRILGIPSPKRPLNAPKPKSTSNMKLVVRHHTGCDASAPKSIHISLGLVCALVCDVVNHNRWIELWKGRIFIQLSSGVTIIYDRLPYSLV